jgi:hypothetical protein
MNLHDRRLPPYYAHGVTVTIKSTTVTATGGVLNIRCMHYVESPMINGIETIGH